MPRYRVEVPEVRYKTVEIEAASPRAAVARALKGDGSLIRVSTDSHLPKGVEGANCQDTCSGIWNFVDVYDEYEA